MRRLIGMNRQIRLCRSLILIFMATWLMYFSTSLSADQSMQDLNSIIHSLAPIQNSDSPASVDLNIRFKLGYSQLSPAAHRQLDELGAALTSKTLENSILGIYGHTDAKGTANSNKNLSLKRAQSVANYLIEQFEINPERLRIKGFGEERLKNPISPNAAENRRVEIVNLTPKNNRPLSNDAVDESGKMRW